MATTTTQEATEHYTIIGMDGTVYEGSPVEIFEEMRSQAFDSRESLESYLDATVERVLRFHEVRITIRGETLMEKCRTLLADLARYGFVTISTGPTTTK